MRIQQAFKKRVLPLFAVAAVAAIVFASPAWAVFSLEVDPVRGGNDIRFSPVRAGEEPSTEEVNVIIRSDEGRQYRLIQEVLSPLVNEKGETLRSDAVKIFSPDSVQGMLRIVHPTALNVGQSTLYVSDSSGTADAFRLVFAVDLNPEDPGGHFQSQIRFQLEAVEGGVGVVTVIKNIYVEVSAEFAVRIRDPQGGSALDLGRVSNKSLKIGGNLEVDVSSNLGSTYRIYQQLTQPLTNENGQTLDSRYVLYQASSSLTGSAPVGQAALSTARDLIFTSEENGAGTNFTISFEALEVQKAPAGNYASTLSYTVESDGVISNQPRGIPVKLAIEEILHLEVEYEGGSLNFGQFKYAGESQSQHVRIKAHNNTGASYAVTQVVTRLFTNENDEQIPAENFTARMEGEVEGEMAYPQKTSVEIGEKVIYTSDSRGNPAVFDVYYELTLPKEAKGGSYGSELMFSISAV